MKKRRINVTLAIAALALTALLIPTALPRASTAASRLERQPLESLSTLNAAEATESSAPLSAFSVPSVASVVQSPGTTTRVSAALRSTPIMFIENAGQFAEDACFQAQASSSPQNWEIVFQDDFNDGDDAGWTRDRPSDWSLQNGEYVLSFSGYNIFSASWAGSDSWTDYAVEFSVKNIACVDDGLAFRGGQYRLNLRHGTNYGAPDVRLWGPSGILADPYYPLGRNIWYRVRVEVIGQRIKVFIDGNLVIDYVDSNTPVSSGNIALLGWSGACGSLVAHFDNVVVYGAPAPFLDLPFDYGGSVQAFVQALQDTDDGGRVDSWFDHKYPDGFKNQRLVLYDGRERTKNLYNQNLGCYERRCYDGHNGFDFTYVDPQPEVPDSQDLPIQPAAAGKVVVVQPDSGSDYGNCVIVDHQNGYFTRYAHLKAIHVSQEQTVTTNDSLGIMGSTGYSNGTHLHFGVYRDNGNGQWDGESVDKPVDPYKWKGDSADPWVADRQGPTSYYLWIHEMSTQNTVSGNQGATMTDTTGNVQASIPPNAFSGQATFELSPGPVAGSSAQLRSSGHSFWLRLLEWLPGGGGLQTTTALQSTTQLTLTQPITFTVIYTDTDVLHLDVPQLALHRWDEDQEVWHPLTTTVDSDNHVVTAQTEDLGDFDLQAPLLCATDDLEPDDGYAAARWVWPNDWSLARGLDIPQDSDWSRFDAVQGVTYTISTQNLAVGADTVLNLYDVDALTLLASNDDAGGGPASELVWTAPYTGTFFVEVVSAPGGTTDCSATYELTITTIPGDVIADCQVDAQDLQAVADHWRQRAGDPGWDPRFDLDSDGDVDVADVLRVAAAWGNRCP